MLRKNFLGHVTSRREGALLRREKELARWQGQGEEHKQKVKIATEDVANLMKKLGRG